MYRFSLSDSNGVRHRKTDAVSTMQAIAISDVLEPNVHNATAEEKMSAEPRSNPVEERFIRSGTILCVGTFVEQ